jgi:hypothetical protein
MKRQEPVILPAVQTVGMSLGLVPLGMIPAVRQLALKGTGEARCSAAKRPGLMKKEQGEFKRSGFQPSAKLCPATQIPCIGWLTTSQP